MADIFFKQKHPFDSRRKLANDTLAKNPNHVPIICEPTAAGFGQSMLLDKVKYLVVKDAQFGYFMHTIRRRIHLPGEKAMFFFIGSENVLPVHTATMGELYAQHRDSDGFLYVKYSYENVFGGDRICTPALDVPD